MSEAIYYDLRPAGRLAPSLASQLARELGRKIVSGAYPPGQLIEDEDALATHFEVSRSVVREAVKILAGKGLLTTRRGVGTRVQPRDRWGLLDDDVLAWHQSIAPSMDYLRQLMDIRSALEPRAARWAAERGEEDDIAEIKKALQGMKDTQETVEAFVMADALFHRAIMKAARNEFLTSLEGVINSALLASIRLTNRNPLTNEESIPFHEEVCDAIAARDGHLAEIKMESLLGDTQQRLQAL
ncbi:MAG: FadR/GntR family transcriptional regulator [Pseudomonadota bacterium]